MSEGYEVCVLSDGYSYLDDDKVMTSNCTCTLIKGPKNIIVDTMTPWDSKTILDGLRAHRLEVDDIDFVVSTHGHPDHLGNNHLFLNAIHLVGLTQMKRDKFLDPFKSGEEYPIDGDLVRVFPTPGHTLDSVSVRVQTTGLGTVVIAGDLFEREEDIAYPKVWQEAGSDCAAQQIENRAKVLLAANYVVPGHGPMFRVTDYHRREAARWAPPAVASA